MSTKKMFIVCVDDESIVLNSLREELRHSLGDSFQYEINDNAEEALSFIREVMDDGMEVALVISDQLMPGMKGDEFLIEVNKISPETRKILLTGQASADAVGRAVNFAKLYRYIAKPWDVKDLMMTVEGAVQSYQIDKELDARVQMLNDLEECTSSINEAVTLAGAVERILEASVRKTRSDKGLLITTRDGGLHTMLVGRMEGESTYSCQSVSPGDVMEYMPLAVLNKLKTADMPLVADIAFKEDDWKDDQYVSKNRIRSFYARRIERNGQLSGYLYLEAAEKEHFTRMTQEYLSLLSKHASITLDNAKLYDNLEAKVQERTLELATKNQDITDSLEYARRIQHSILPLDSHFDSWFKNHYIFYKPKDIVCGDFYWINQKSDQLVLAAVDCTGHGVPGAFMTMLGYNLLNQIVLEEGQLEPAKVLASLNTKIRKALKQEKDGGNQDGMDLALCTYNPQKQTIAFAGANRLLLHQSGGSLTEVKGDRRPIGGTMHTEEPFQTNYVVVQPGDRIFLFTDGMQDQMGGPDYKKLTFKRMLEELEKGASAGMMDQCKNLTTLFTEWMGDNGQMDDVLFMGFEIK